MLSADLASGITGELEQTYTDPTTGKSYELHATQVDFDGTSDTPPSAANSTPTSYYPLTSVPVLNSLPGARASLYLNFKGGDVASWGAYSQISTPAYDIDGNPYSFSDSELASIRSIWSYVAEDYAPFNINVTTVAPQNLDNGFGMELYIGGSGSWLGASYGGISYVGSFSNDMPNISFVFTDNLASGNARYTADAASHEAGHAFGLSHQSSFNGSRLTQEYSTGPGNGIAPIMGNSYSASRSLWWNGTTDVSPTTYQDDMSIIAGPQNGFGYRPESAGTTAATATLLPVNGTQLSASGVLLTGADVNYYTILAGVGQGTFTISGAMGYNNLVPTLQLLDSTGTVLLSTVSTPINGSAATISYSFTQAGGYKLVVRSDGTYGNAGQYTISGSIVSATSALFVQAPSNLTLARRNDSEVDISWTDNSLNETGYRVLRSENGGNWITIAPNLPAGSNFYVDTNVKSGRTYNYRVVAYSVNMTSSPSNNATVAIPFPSLSPPTNAPTPVITRLATNSVTISWNNEAGSQTGYIIQRSANGAASWSTVSVVTSATTSYTDRSLKTNRQYQYRIVSFNAQGNSSPGGAVEVSTSKAAVMHFKQASQPPRFAKGRARKASALKFAQNKPAAAVVPNLSPAMRIALPAQSIPSNSICVNWTPVVG